MKKFIKFHKKISNKIFELELELIGENFSFDGTYVEMNSSIYESDSLKESSKGNFTIKALIHLIKGIRFFLENELEKDIVIEFNKANIKLILSQELWGPVIKIQIGKEDIFLEDDDIREFLYFLNLMQYVTKESEIYYTNSKRLITYCGERFSKTIGPLNKNTKLTLNKLFEALLVSWERETAYPSSQNDVVFNIDNDPSFGQCAVTAMIVQYYFGGDIYNLRTEDGVSHYFNVINREVIDMTKDQFDLYLLPLDYSKSKKVSKEYFGKSENTAYRYKILKDKVDKVLNKNLIS